MTVRIYGLRLRGDHEVRYVGLTRKTLNARLRDHLYQAAGGSPALRQWFNEHRGAVEAFAIAETECRSEAFRIERDTIEAALRLGQRLFNQMHVPHQLRLAA